MTLAAKEGVVFMFQSYENADVNRIIGWNHLDPYSGFPGYRTVRCKLEKRENSKEISKEISKENSKENSKKGGAA